jgi:tetratricopeptide (TPR) repeat protein
MSVYDQIEQHRADGIALYRRGRFAEAALAYERAFELAERSAGNELAAGILTQLAIVRKAAGDDRGSMAAVLKIRECYPNAVAVKVEAHIQKVSFGLIYDERPDVQSLEERISQLEDLSRSNGDSFRSGVYQMRAQLFAAQGLYDLALQESEAAWSNRRTGGECEVCGLSRLVEATVDAGDRAKSEIWLGELAGQPFRPETCRGKQLLAESAFSLRFGSVAEATRASRLLFEHIEHMSDPGSWLVAREHRANTAT